MPRWVCTHEECKDKKKTFGFSTFMEHLGYHNMKDNNGNTQAFSFFCAEPCCDAKFVTRLHAEEHTRTKPHEIRALVEEIHGRSEGGIAFAKLLKTTGAIEGYEQRREQNRQEWTSGSARNQIVTEWRPSTPDALPGDHQKPPYSPRSPRSPGPDSAPGTPARDQQNLFDHDSLFDQFKEWFLSNPQLNDGGRSMRPYSPMTPLGTPGHSAPGTPIRMSAPGTPGDDDDGFGITNPITNPRSNVCRQNSVRRGILTPELYNFGYPNCNTRDRTEGQSPAKAPHIRTARVPGTPEKAPNTPLHATNYGAYTGPKLLPVPRDGLNQHKDRSRRGYDDDEHDPEKPYIPRSPGPPPERLLTPTKVPSAHLHPTNPDPWHFPASRDGQNQQSESTSRVYGEDEHDPSKPYRPRSPTILPVAEYFSRSHRPQDGFDQHTDMAQEDSRTDKLQPTRTYSLKPKKTLYRIGTPRNVDEQPSRKHLNFDASTDRYIGPSRFHRFQEDPTDQQRDTAQRDPRTDPKLLPVSSVGQNQQTVRTTRDYGDDEHDPWKPHISRSLGPLRLNPPRIPFPKLTPVAPGDVLTPVVEQPTVLSKENLADQRTDKAQKDSRKDDQQMRPHSSKPSGSLSSVATPGTEGGVRLIPLDAAPNTTSDPRLNRTTKDDHDPRTERRQPREDKHEETSGSTAESIAGAKVTPETPGRAPENPVGKLIESASRPIVDPNTGPKSSRDGHDEPINTERRVYGDDEHDPSKPYYPRSPGFLPVADPLTPKRHTGPSNEDEDQSRPISRGTTAGPKTPTGTPAKFPEHPLRKGTGRTSRPTIGLYVAPHFRDDQDQPMAHRDSRKHEHHQSRRRSPKPRGTHYPAAKSNPGTPERVEPSRKRHNSRRTTGLSRDDHYHHRDRSRKDYGDDQHDRYKPYHHRSPGPPSGHEDQDHPRPISRGTTARPNTPPGTPARGHSVRERTDRTTRPTADHYTGSKHSRDAHHHHTHRDSHKHDHHKSRRRSPKHRGTPVAKYEHHQRTATNGPKRHFVSSDGHDELTERRERPHDDEHKEIWPPMTPAATGVVSHGTSGNGSGHDDQDLSRPNAPIGTRGPKIPLGPLGRGGYSPPRKRPFYDPRTSTTADSSPAPKRRFTETKEMSADAPSTSSFAPGVINASSEGIDPHQRSLEDIFHQLTENRKAEEAAKASEAVQKNPKYESDPRDEYLEDESDVMEEFVIIDEPPKQHTEAHHHHRQAPPKGQESHRHRSDHRKVSPRVILGEKAGGSEETRAPFSPDYTIASQSNEASSSNRDSGQRPPKKVINVLEETPRQRGFPRADSHRRDQERHIPSSRRTEKRSRKTDTNRRDRGGPDRGDRDN